MDYLDFDVIRRAKKMAVSRVDNHAWADMEEEEILRSAGLIISDPDTGKEGITLAAILLLEKTVQLCLFCRNIKRMQFSE